jgi:hypothetical protein
MPTTTATTTNRTISDTMIAILAAPLSPLLLLPDPELSEPELNPSLPVLVVVPPLLVVAVVVVVVDVVVACW